MLPYCFPEDEEENQVQAECTNLRQAFAVTFLSISLKKINKKKINQMTKCNVKREPTVRIEGNYPPTLQLDKSF